MFTRRISLVLLLMTAPHGFADAPAVAFRKEADHVRITVGTDDFATYTFRDPNIPRPYLAHVRVPGGPQVTRNHPPVPGKDATDHDTFGKLPVERTGPDTAKTAAASAAACADMRRRAKR